MDEFFKTKIYALLHDPITKVLLIFENIDHKKFMLDKLRHLDIVPNDYQKEVVKVADRISSSLDRFGLNFIEDNEPVWKITKKYRTDKISFFNIFSQTWIENSYYEEINRCKHDIKNTYDEILGEILSKIRNLPSSKIIFNTLWTWYEIEIIRKLRTLPQDTRVPIFDILDHVYSTASLVNLLYNGGYFVIIDIPSVQDFIKKGRKFRDLYIGSWLISILMYLVLEEIANKYGADCVITPTLRLNPFWIYRKYLDLKELRGSIEELGRIIWESYKELGLLEKDWYKYAIIPGAASIVIPKISDREFEETESKERLRNFIREIFKKKLNEILKCSKIIDYAKIILEKLLKIEDILIKEYYKDLNEEERRRRAKIILSEKSIEEIVESFRKIIEKLFIPKIAIAEIDKNFIKQFKEEVTVKIESKNIQYQTHFRFWCEVIDKIEEEFRKEYAMIKYKPYIFEVKDFEKILIDRYKTLCSNCGELPAIIRINREYWDDVLLKLPRNERDKLRKMFKPGETLCPICFFKRLFSYEPYKELLKELFKKEDELIFPDIEDMPDLQIRREVVEKMIRDENYCEKLLSILEKEFNSLYTIITKILEYPREVFKERLIEEFLKRKGLSFKNIDIDKFIKKRYVYPFALFIYGLERLKDEYIISLLKQNISREDIERKLPEVDTLYREFISELCRRKLVSAGRIHRYYALLIADGDNIGNMVQGFLSDALIFSKYKTKDAKELYSKIFEEIFERTLPSYKKDILDKVSAIINNDKALIKTYYKDEGLGIKEEKRYRFPISISYQVAISRSLMISSLLEVKRIKDLGGYVIYAGGDDLMAISPVISSIDILNETRKIFSGKHNGYHKIYNYYIQGLGYIGRTYSLAICHIYDPLYTVLETCRTREKIGKEKEYMFENYNLRKNILSLIYTRGYEEHIIPFTFEGCNNCFDVKSPLIDFEEILDEIHASRIYSIIYNYRDELKNMLNTIRDREQIKDYIRYLLEKGTIQKDKIDFVLSKINNLLNTNLFMDDEHILIKVFDVMKIFLRYRGGACGH